MGDGGGNSKVVPFWKGVYSKMKDERICSQGVGGGGCKLFLFRVNCFSERD